MYFTINHKFQLAGGTRGKIYIFYRYFSLDQSLLTEWETGRQCNHYSHTARPQITTVCLNSNCRKLEMKLPATAKPHDLMYTFSPNSTEIMLYIMSWNVPLDKLKDLQRTRKKTSLIKVICSIWYADSCKTDQYVVLFHHMTLSVCAVCLYRLPIALPAINIIPHHMPACT